MCELSLVPEGVNARADGPVRGCHGSTVDGRSDPWPQLVRHDTAPALVRPRTVGPIVVRRLQADRRLAAFKEARTNGFEDARKRDGAAVLAVVDHDGRQEPD